MAISKNCFQLKEWTKENKTYPSFSHFDVILKGPLTNIIQGKLYSILGWWGD